MSSINQSIAHMMEVINPRRKTDFKSPSFKRRLSDSSFESPDKRNKSENALDVSWVGSPQESRRMRNDLIAARNTITNLEHRIQHMHGIRKEMETMFDNEVKSLQFQHDQDSKKIEDLEQQLQSLRKRERDAKREVEEMEHIIRQNKMDYECQITDLEFSVNELQLQIEAYENVENEQVSIVQTDNNELTEALDKAEKEAEMYKELVADLKSRLSRLTNVNSDLEIKEQMLQTATMKVKELEYTIESYGEWQIQSKLNQKKIMNYPELEKECQKLREEAKNLKDVVQNKLILEEQVHDLNTRLEHYRNQDKKFSALQISNAQLEQSVTEWNSVARNYVEAPCLDSSLPRHLKQVIDRLQQQEISLTSEKIQLESQLKTAQQDLKVSKAEVEKLQKLNIDLKNHQQQHQVLIHRLQKKLQLVARERDSYRTQLDSYEKDLTLYVAPGNHGDNSQLSAHKERIDNLEKIVEGYRDMISNLEAQLKEAQPHLYADSAVPIRSEQVTRLQDEVEKLQAENQRLTERCDELEIRLEEELVGKDKVDGKVIHLKLNPLSECVADNETNIEKLRDENDRLKRKIKSLEEGLETTKLSESICSSREVQSLREEKKSLEIRMQRLKDLFKQSSSDFRDVCYLLFGYKIDRVNNTTYKISSMYAETPDDYLEFHYQDSNVNMIETPFSATLDELIDLHLRHQGSIPAFLSAVTMDLFNRTTMAVRTYVE